ncbi:prepilin peptidase [Sulfitobacter sabulilitoris]|uniref:Prepilin peptidase n=1 Tax=Sulfitobacter sabulilitoris TaxID=2562655 RepID=A0A5S3PD38_9RHOB|nr:A24 family peptidase [Sulfitobacter sabulilitoris]TMM51784.1 prepilin peptidase [Sulfitobacter sabulilitoris]
MLTDPAALAATLPVGPAMALSVVLFGALAALCWHDLRDFRLPDALTLPLIALGLIAAGWQAGGFPVGAVVGAVVGYGSFAAIGWAYFRRRGIDGLGLGDAKLLAAAGAWLGWAALPLVVLGAALPALVFALVTRRDTARRIAFGPWLCASFAVLWLAQLAGLGFSS